MLSDIQICQETSPDFFEEMAASGHTDVELDAEIHAPVIHDTITSSPPDSDLLGAVPFSIATESAFQFSEESVFDEPTEEDVADIFPGQHVPVQESPAPEPEAKITSTPKPFREISSSPDVPVSPIPEISDSFCCPCAWYSCWCTSYTWNPASGPALWDWYRIWFHNRKLRSWQPLPWNHWFGWNWGGGYFWERRHRAARYISWCHQRARYDVQKRFITYYMFKKIFSQLIN